jgi:outer membrane protein OmpA-like peptidoglycan-associated protein
VDVAFLDVRNTTAVFKQGSAQFDFGSTWFSKFYKDLDNAFDGLAPDIFGMTIVITIDGPQDPLGVERANAIKEDMVKRKMNKNRISVQFGGNASSSAFTIFGSK